MHVLVYNTEQLGVYLKTSYIPNLRIQHPIEQAFRGCQPNLLVYRLIVYFAVI